MTALETLRTVFLWVARASWHASWLVVLVLAAQGLLRHRLTPHWRHALWLLVVARLAVPVAPSSSFSVFNLTPSWLAAGPETSVRPVAALSDPGIPGTPLVPLGLPREGGGSGREGLAASVTRSEGNPFLPVATEPAAGAVSAPESVGMARRSAAGPATSTTRPAARWDSWEVVAVIWAVGVVVWAGAVAGAYLRCAARLAGQSCRGDARARAIWDECCRTMKVRRRVEWVETATVESPALFGLGRVWLLLPERFGESFSDAELRHVFRHELAHVRRGDVEVNVLVTLLQILHWWNPLVWLAAARLRLDRELAADALALACGQPEENRAYGETILRVLTGVGRPSVRPGLVGILEDRDQVAQRLRRIMAYRPPSAWSGWAAGLWIILAVVGCTDGHPRAASVSAVNDAASARTHREYPTVTAGREVRVVVREAESGRPIEGAEVLAPNRFTSPREPRPGGRWITDGSGVARIRLGERSEGGPFPGAWFGLSVRHPRYAGKGWVWMGRDGDGDGRAGVPETLEVRLEQGIQIGGIVKDASGRPVPGVDVSIYGSGYHFGWITEPERQHGYGEYWRWPEEGPRIVTDADGRWSAPHFPRDLDQVTVEFRPPGGVAHTVEHVPLSERAFRLAGKPLVDLAGLRNGTAETILPAGYTVRGRVVRPDGSPVARARVREGHGMGPARVDGEFLTDADGRFRVERRPARETIFMAEVDGFALGSTIVAVGPQAEEALIRLQPAKPMRLRFVNDVGQPLAGVRVVCDRGRTEAQLIDFEAVTGADGWMVWTNAPLDAVVLFARNPGAPEPRVLTIDPLEREREIAWGQADLQRSVRVEARVVDAETGQPVKVSEVAHRLVEGQRTPAPFYTDEWSELPGAPGGGFRLTVPGTAFLTGSGAKYQLRVRAPRYRTWLSPLREVLDGDGSIVVRLRRGEDPRGVIRRPDGEAAARARVRVQSEEQLPVFVFEESDKVIPARSSIQVGDDGTLEIADPGYDATLVIEHSSGFAATTVRQFTAQGGVTLEAWGQLRGVVRQRGKPLPGVIVSLSTSSGYPPRWMGGTSVTTDAQGGFVFERLPPAEYALSWLELHGSGPYPPVCQERVRVVAGRPTEVVLGGRGRPVIGRFSGSYDWRFASQWLTTQTVVAEPAVPDPDAYVTLASLQRAIDESSRARDRYEATRRHYPIRIWPDGTFRLEDVPAGNYVLRVEVRPSQSEPRTLGAVPWRSGNPIASLSREVRIPPPAPGKQDESVDLGPLELERAEGAAR